MAPKKDSDSGNEDEGNAGTAFVIEVEDARPTGGNGGSGVDTDLVAALAAALTSGQGTDRKRPLVVRGTTQAKSKGAAASAADRYRNAVQDHIAATDGMDLPAGTVVRASRYQRAGDDFWTWGLWSGKPIEKNTTDS